MQHADRVLERLAGEDVARLDVALDEIDDRASRLLGEVTSPRVDGRDRRAAWQREPERLRHAGHGRGGAHGHAVAVRARDRVLDLDELGLGDPAGAELLVVVPAVRAGSELAAAPVPVQHRPAGDDDRGDVRARRSEDAGRVRLVAAREQDDTVERVGADRLLHVHRHQVPVQHRRRLHQRLAERHHRELEREAARLQHAALDRLGQTAQVDVAVHELAPAVADPDQRLAAERLIRDAARLQPRAVQEAVEIAAVHPLRAPAAASTLIEARSVSHCRHVAPSQVSEMVGRRHSSAAWSTTAPLPPHRRQAASPSHSGQRVKAARATSSVSPQAHRAKSVSIRSSNPSKACPRWMWNDPTPASVPVNSTTMRRPII